MIAKFADSLADLAASLERRGDDFAWSSVRRHGEALAELGGGALMERVVDRLGKRHGPAVAALVLPVWDGVPGWGRNDCGGDAVAGAPDWQGCRA